MVCDPKAGLQAHHLPGLGGGRVALRHPQENTASFRLLQLAGNQGLSFAGNYYYYFLIYYYF